VASGGVRVECCTLFYRPNGINKGEVELTIISLDSTRGSVISYARYILLFLFLVPTYVMLCFIIVRRVLAGFLRTRPNVADYYVFHLTASAKKTKKERERLTFKKNL
jgi:hypothetical protein